LEAVKRDIAEGIKVKVTSTPTYLINGIPFTGGVTPAMFEEVAVVLREPSR
jgi:protein-disulfide isomerase